MSASGAPEPFNQENRRPGLNDCFRVSETRECPNWTSGANDRSCDLGRNSELNSNVGTRCRPVLGLNLGLLCAPGTLPAEVGVWVPAHLVTT